MLWRLVAATAICAALWIVAVASWIGAPPPPRFARADAAIVLGAPLAGDWPGPVFQARIDRGIALVRSGRVTTLILTGGRSRGSLVAEAEAARRTAAAAGIPDSRILVEHRSSTTAGNLEGAAALMHRNRLRTALIVSDPLHLRRAMWLADLAGIAGSPDPVVDGRYSGPKALAHEVLAWHRDVILR